MNNLSFKDGNSAIAQSITEPKKRNVSGVDYNLIDADAKPTSFYFGNLDSPKLKDKTKNHSIEMEPEWILYALPPFCEADGSGTMNIEVQNITDLRFVVLALKALGVDIIMYSMNYPNYDSTCWGIQFKIEDIKNGCPTLYAKWLKMDEEAKIERTFDKVIESFVSEMSNEVPFKTFQAYRNLRFYLKDYCHSKGIALCWKCLSDDYDQDWQAYMRGTKLSLKTIRRYIKARMDFKNWCWENRITNIWM